VRQLVKLHLDFDSLINGLNHSRTIMAGN
jgi:hypothetical protein